MKQRIIFAVTMSSVLTFLMSAWVTFINIGMVEGFAGRWMSAWLLAWPAAAIISFTFGPGIHRWSHNWSDRYLSSRTLSPDIESRASRD